LSVYFDGVAGHQAHRRAQPPAGRAWLWWRRWSPIGSSIRAP